MRIYTDNQVGTIDDVVSPAQNIPWENFLGSAVLCMATGMLEKSHPELANEARVAAIEDWQAAVASLETRDQASYREAAWGATSSLLLGEMTGDEKYKEKAIRFGSLLIQCQEQNFVDGIPITGYFYTDTDRQKVIHNDHGAFEEAPLIALAMLCRELPEHENWINWYSAAVLHSEFFMKRGSQIAAPYNLLPNSVWKKSEIMEEPDERRREFNCLENEFIRTGIIPCMGGRIFEAVDKTNGYNFFYRQHVIKPSLTGMIGYWITVSLAWGYPHHHGPNTVEQMA